MIFLQKSYCCLNAKESRRTRVQYFTGSVLTPFQIIIVWWFLADTDRPKPKNGLIPKYRKGKPLSVDIWTGHAEGTETWEGLVYCRWPLAQKKHIYKYK